MIFATDPSDTLTGGGAKDQFVFAPTSSQSTVQHSVDDFKIGLDKIDLRQFGSISSLDDVNIAPQSARTPRSRWTTTRRILLKNVIAATLKASDFIFHIT